MKDLHAELERKGHSELSWYIFMLCYFLLPYDFEWFVVINFMDFLKLVYKYAAYFEYQTVAWNYDKGCYQSSSLKAV